MKLNCGPSAEDRKRARRVEWEGAVAGQHPMEEWRQCFAFLPTRVGTNDCRWFEPLERRYQSRHLKDDRASGDSRWKLSWVGLFGYGWQPEYRALQTVVRYSALG